jgi:hypothetical protein
MTWISIDGMASKLLQDRVVYAAYALADEA